ncbi:proline-rich receptor-like protein kinase PERK9 [Neltuma alba]|uniref:proline-rich receptor-like protein kinase PERK9 n=1 Tax=Neltuma alba TaxID=207710 RepID=UPI0010A41335|nr:proline-rich receptor-like protein kinase PERK9 [Prosopis alba]
MAKNNKYTSINFNHIYEKNSSSISNTNLAKNPAPSLSPSYSAASYSAISAPNKTHGRMLVLTRPPPKPLPSQLQHPPQQQSERTQQVPDQPPSNPGSDAISLRPLGRTGTGSSLSPPVSNHDKDKELPPAMPMISPKSDKFVPPHLRPGFIPRENNPGPELSRPQRQQGHAGYPGRYAENGRPKSGGYERMRRGGLSDSGMMNRPRSSGSRPSSSG